MSGGYRVASGTCEVLLAVKKSKFIARAAPATDRESALALLAQARQDYPDARHHCWAYVIGDPYSPSRVACSDDGEPGGTAGKPMLNVLQHTQLGNIMLVVIRYFGGVKLGAGGLVRAYSQAAQLVVDKLPIAEATPMVAGVVTGDFAIEQPLRHWLAVHQGALVASRYGSPCEFRLSCAVARVSELAEFIRAQGADWRAD